MPPNFIANDEVCIQLKNLIDSHLIRRLENKIVRGTFSTDELTQCPRRLICRSMQLEKPSINTEFAKAYLSDKAIKDKWIKLLKNCPGVDFAEENAIFSDNYLNLVAHVDAIVRINNIVMTVKIVPLSSDKYKEACNNHHARKHVVSAITELWLSELKEGLVIYENKDTTDYMIFRIFPTKAIIQAVDRKLRALISHKVREHLPKRPYDDNTALECCSCEFKITCWNNQSDENQEEKQNAQET